MSSRAELVPLIEREAAASFTAESSGDIAAAWVALERAHIAAQPLAVIHILVHARMIRLAWRQRDFVEVLGQVLLLPLAGIGSVTGIYPVGGGRFRRSDLEMSGVPEDILAAVPRASGRLGSSSARERSKG